MLSNSIEYDNIQHDIVQIVRNLEKIELFFVGQQIDTARIQDASIGSLEIADLSITNAKFADTSITNAKITSIDATDLTTGTLSADRIAASSIKAEKLSVSSLDAIAADFGTMTAGTLNGLTIVGGTIRTATSGNRVEMTASPNAMKIYNGSDEKTVIDPDGIHFKDSAMHIMDGATFKSSWFLTGTGIQQWYIQSGNVGEFDIINATSGGDINFVVSDGQLECRVPVGKSVFINGTAKAAIVLTSQGYRAVHALESPEVWFFDFFKRKDGIPKDFSEITEGHSHILETDQGEFLVFRKRKGFHSIRFESKTLQQFNENNAFWGDI